MQVKALIKNIPTEQHLPHLLEALNILHKLSYYHNMAKTYHGYNYNERANYWYSKSQDFLNNLIITHNNDNMENNTKYTVHNTTHDSYLTPSPYGNIGEYIFGLEKEKAVWFANEAYAEAQAQKYNEMYPECTFKIIIDADS
jgi:hypothetical protein